jgi:hypothetical protein
MQETRELKGRQVKHAHVLADIGDRLIAAKEKLPARCWSSWLRQEGIEFTRQTAENDMALARVRFGSAFEKLLAAGLRSTYRLGTCHLSNGLTDLTPERVEQVSLTDLKAVLNPTKPAQPPEACFPFDAADRASLARSVGDLLAWMSERAAGMKEKGEPLEGTAKAEVLARIEAFRRVVLAWPAFATPAQEENRLSGGSTAAPQ